MSFEKINSNKEGATKVILEYGNQLIESSSDLVSRVSLEIHG